MYLLTFQIFCILKWAIFIYSRFFKGPKTSAYLTYALNLKNWLSVDCNEYGIMESITL